MTEGWLWASDLSHDIWMVYIIGKGWEIWKIVCTMRINLPGRLAPRPILKNWPSTKANSPESSFPKTYSRIGLPEMLFHKNANQPSGRPWRPIFMEQLPGEPRCYWGSSDAIQTNGDPAAVPRAPQPGWGGDVRLWVHVVDGTRDNSGEAEGRRHGLGGGDGQQQCNGEKEPLIIRRVIPCVGVMPMRILVDRDHLQWGRTMASPSI